AMGAVRGIACNTLPGSPYFGWVYVSDSNTNSNSRGDGLFAFGSDLSDILGQGNAPRTAGYPGFGSSTTWSPYKLSVAPDGSVLVADHSGGESGDPGSTPNLIAVDPLLTTFGYVLKPNSVNPINNTNGVAPVGTNNNHGGIAHGIIVGTGASTRLFTMDE